MGKRQRDRKDGPGHGPGGATRGGRSGGGGRRVGSSGGRGSSRGSWLRTHGRDLRFLVVFATLMGLYYAATTTTFATGKVFPAYLRLNARAAGVILGAVGYDITVTDQTLREKRFTVEVGRGCDAVEPSALFVSAVLASPVPLSARLVAAVVGTVVLMTINLIRIMNLLLTGIYAPKLFDIMHLDIWQALFIFLAILLWALWAARWARKRRARQNDGST